RLRYPAAFKMGTAVRAEKIGSSAASARAIWFGTRRSEHAQVARRSLTARQRRVACGAPPPRGEVVFTVHFEPQAKLSCGEPSRNNGDKWASGRIWDSQAGKFRRCLQVAAHVRFSVAEWRSVQSESIRPRIDVRIRLSFRTSAAEESSRRA